LISKNFVIVVGYGWSGSGAAIDLLDEFEGCKSLEGEFRIAKDPYGLLDLETALVDDWDFIRNDVAIRDFLEYVEMLSRGTGLFRRVGKSFSKKLMINLVKYSQIYIRDLTDLVYFGDTFVHRYKISAYKSFLTKIRTRYGFNNGKEMFMARLSHDQFEKITKRYINNIFKNFFIYHKIDTVILDQAIAPENIEKPLRYFNNSKIIIVDRDPRDIYCNMIRGNGLLGADLNIKDSAEKYIKWHNIMRWKSRNYHQDRSLKSNVLRLYFEDLVLDYENTIFKLEKFLNKEQDKSLFQKFFNPEKSLKNVGLWKKHPDQELMEFIAKQIPNDCINL